MNFSKIVIFGFLLWGFLLLEKYLFLGQGSFTSAWQEWSYYLLLIVACRMLSRRFGAINFIEAIFIALVWIFEILILDSLIAKKLFAGAVFRSGHYWWSFLVLLLAVFFLHKKRHIEVRKRLREEHHRHGYH